MEPAPWIDAAVSIHDKYQIEFKLTYPLPKGRAKTSYEVQFYVFSPISLGINPSSYSEQQFYTDLQKYIRIKTPSIPLNLIAEAGTNPLGRLRTSIEAMICTPSNETQKGYENQTKLFCCILKSAIRDYVDYVHRTEIVEDRVRMVDNYVRDVRRITDGYRDLRDMIQTPVITKRSAEIYSFGDEYISLLAEDYTYHLIERLLSREGGLCEKNERELRAIIDGEIHYRTKRGYGSIPDEKKDNETLVFRQSVLKKYMSTVLFLDAEAKRGGVLMQQTIFGLAAGAAMLFATTVAFISQSIYGNLTLPFLVALVVSYIFKDRLKDLLRFYLSRKMTQFIFDYRTKIYNVAHHIVGVCSESFEFVRRKKLSWEILAIRGGDHITEIENGWVGEQIFLYRKRLRLKPDWKGSIYSEYEIEGINDVMRFSIQDFLRKMDDPSKELFVMDDEGYHRITGSRVYHLNMIIRLVGDKEQSYSRYRLILNRQGIKRIEKVRTM